MNNISPRKIKTGGDPRTLADYSALRDELSKLTHPARPDVDWHYVEKRCLSLFGRNGVELQTAAWYTLARAQLAGLAGLNEGLALLDALITHQWGTLWPQPMHARTEILSGLSLRLQQLMRRLSLNYSDLSQLYQAEQALASIGLVLQRFELSHLSQLDALQKSVHSSAVRLENSHGSAGADAVFPPCSMLKAVEISDTERFSGNYAGISGTQKNQPDPVKWVYVVQPAHQPHTEVAVAATVSGKSWTAFAAGMGTMLLISMTVAGGWYALHRTEPLQTRLAASLAPLPAALAPAQLDVLRHHSSLPPTFIAQTQEQLTRLDKLPADWHVAYGWQLAKQAQTLWPEQAESLIQQWQQHINASVLPANAMNGWHEGMSQLQILADKLDALDGQRGKYITVSELKTQVFGAITHFRQTVPVEEQFRLLKLLPESSPLRQQQIQQADRQLRAQIYTLAQENIENDSRN